MFRMEIPIRMIVVEWKRKRKRVDLTILISDPIPAENLRDRVRNPMINYQSHLRPGDKTTHSFKLQFPWMRPSFPMNNRSDYAICTSKPYAILITINKQPSTLLHTELCTKDDRFRCPEQWTALKEGTTTTIKTKKKLTMTKRILSTSLSSGVEMGMPKHFDGTQDALYLFCARQTDTTSSTQRTIPKRATAKMMEKRLSRHSSSLE